MNEEFTSVRNPKGQRVKIRTSQLKPALLKGYSIVNSTESQSFVEPAISGAPPKNPTLPGNNMAAEDLIPPAFGVVGGIVGGAATLPSGAGVPFGATIGAGTFGGAGQSIRNTIRAYRGKPVPPTPEASLKSSGIEGSKQAAAALIGGGVQWGLDKVFRGAPKVLMNKVLEVNKKRLQAEALDQAEEIGSKAASEWKNFGRSSSEMLDRIKTEMPKVGKKISAAVDKAKAVEIDTLDFYERAVRPIINKLEPDPASAGDIARINNLFTKYVNKYGNNISLKNLERLKISLYDKIADGAWWKSMDKLPNNIKATVNIAREARREISKHVPEIAKLNESYGTMASMKAYLAGAEAGNQKSIFKLFLEPAYEKTLTGAAVPLQKMSAPFGIPLVEGSKRVVPPLVHSEINRRRLGLSFPSIDNER